jgi:hypothetical protein
VEGQERTHNIQSMSLYDWIGLVTIQVNWSGVELVNSSKHHSPKALNNTFFLVLGSIPRSYDHYVWGKEARSCGLKYHRRKGAKY